MGCTSVGSFSQHGYLPLRPSVRVQNNKSNNLEAKRPIKALASFSCWTWRKSICCINCNLGLSRHQQKRFSAHIPAFCTRNLSIQIFVRSFCQSKSWLNGWCVTSPPLAIVVRYFSSFASATAATKTFPSNNHKCFGRRPGPRTNDQCCGGANKFQQEG